MSGTKPLILVIEDDRDMLEAVRMRLAANGYEVLTSSDGVEGLALAKEQAPDLIILDVMLPKLDGFSVCRILKFDESYKELPIILFSARVQRADLQRGKEVKADAYITKPFKAEDLLAKIKELLTKKPAQP
jgi:DNA-binding response OmpR family regulator